MGGPGSCPGSGRGPQAGAGVRVLREIIRTPAFMDIIRTNARDLDPESAAEAVKVFLWEDVEAAMSLMGSFPQAVNYLVALVLELGRQMDNFPDGLLEQYVRQMAGEIDLQGISQVPGAFGPALATVGFREAAAGALGKAVNAASGMVVKAESQNPDFLRDILGQVDGREVLRAGLAVARSAARWLFSSISRMFVR